MKWNPICECGNHKAVGKAACKACTSAQKALKKGNLRRYDMICAANPQIGEVFEGRAYRRIGDLLVEVN